MAAANFEHPHIDWDSEDLYQEFSRFKSHVEFVFAGPLAKAKDEEKAGWLGTWLGAQGREIYKTLTWGEGEKEKPEIVLKKFETYTRPRKNKRMARHKLRLRKQSAGESFDNFVKDLKLILMDCEYIDVDDILIDTIIEGVYERKLQEKLLDKGEGLTLNQALSIGQQYELSQQQMKLVRDEDPNVLSVKSKGRKTRKHKDKYRNQQNTEPPKPAKLCYRCGKDPQHTWNQGKCPAMGSTCSYCKKPNHWLAVCQRRQKRLQTVTTSSESDSDSMNSISTSGLSASCTDDILQISTAQVLHSQLDNKWIASTQVLKTEIPFRIDTGARCNTITLKDYQRIKHKGELKMSTKILRTYSNHEIKPLAVVDLPVSYHEKTSVVTFQLIDIQQENIISGDTAEELGLIARLSASQNEETPQVPPELEDFPELTKTTGTLPGTYTIKLKPGAQGVVHAPRRLPVSLKERTIQKLNDMEEDEIIAKVQQPTEWVNSMVVNLRNDKIRICIDPKELNEAMKRQHYPMRTIEEVVAEIPGAKVFSVLDAKSGFHQIKLDEDSSYLTTFNTPVGRYRWLRLPFGLKCAPEIFQRIMDQMFEGINGAYAIVDDIIVAGKTVEEHEQILKQVVERATSYNLKLNLQKCNIRQPQVSYVGHLLCSEGLKPDPEKITSITEMPVPQSKEDIKRFLGMVTYLGKFVENLSDVSAPLRNLLKEESSFQWQSDHQQAFIKLKELCTQSPVLSYYNASKPVEIHCDASQSGVGAVLMQDNKPIAYTSRAMTTTETRYAQIEKEMLSIVHACKKFHCYIFGKHVKVYNDHKPLEQIFKKPLLSAPMRLQRMLLSLQWYDLTVYYKPGKEMVVPDTLSRAYLPDTAQPEIRNLEQVNAIEYLSITKERYSQLQRCNETELAELHTVILNGWPDTKQELTLTIRPYWDSQSELAIMDGIVYKGMRLVIPPSMQKDMLQLIHKSHLGIGKCKQRAREVMYWPRMNSDIEETIKNCTKCAQFQKSQQSEPLKGTIPSELPFSEVATVIFEFQSKMYLLTVDYYSKFIEVDPLKNITSATVIETLKSQFSRHGIPVVLRSDTGSQCSSRKFTQFCTEYGVRHFMSSPHLHQANGEAERAVQTVELLWKKGTDKHLALLDYRTTPLEGINLSPAQLLMGRRPRNILPATSSLLQPKPYNSKEVKRHLDLERAKQKYYHDNRGTKELQPLQPGQPIRMAPFPGHNTWSPAVVVKHHSSPRSYVVESGGRKYRRNRLHLRTSTEAANQEAEPQIQQPEDEDIPTASRETQKSDESVPASAPSNTEGLNTAPYYTRSGRAVKAPQRLDL